MSAAKPIATGEIPVAIILTIRPGGEASDAGEKVMGFAALNPSYGYPPIESLSTLRMSGRTARIVSKTSWTSSAPMKSGFSLVTRS